MAKNSMQINRIETDNRVTITEEDFIASIENAFQFISYYHPKDFIQSLHQAWVSETSPAAKDAIAQILTNSYMCAMDRRPLCQDTGIAVVFLKIGMNIQWYSTLSVQEMVDEGVRRAYLNSDNKLRTSILADPAGARTNTKDNTPAIVHIEMVQGSTVEVTCAAKGGGSENKARLAMLNPSDSIVDWVLKTLPTLGAGWCPPGVLGIGIGGTPEKAMIMAKQSLMEPITIHALIAKNQANPATLTPCEKLRLELYDKINQLNIGAQGLGGPNTVLDVKILDYPTHAASLPVAIIPNCAASRHVSFTLDGNGVPVLPIPNLSDYPAIPANANSGIALNVDSLKLADLVQFKRGDKVLLTGKIFTARDAAHQKLIDMINSNQPLPVDLKNRIIYYVGPVDAVKDEVVGPAGPTTATRMDKFTPQLLEKTGLLGMIGKAERGQVTIDAIHKNNAIYFIAIGGAAYLISKAIKKAKIIAFPELGMEAIYELEVENMPVTVAIDSMGNTVYPLNFKE